ncbi:YfhO family protein [Companilactobacillus huachuanensis]|uniref:YfhO family protein n=1 Tax=Companilactobacillus huachuanensis TaxID=2559914 RepID=A0ABW1RLA2_9LACO|nr:YfhO family protein [Companilactobacillus huachuanensis]
MNLNKIKKISYYPIAFLIPFIIVTLVFVNLHLTPFGNQNLLISDTGTQYLSFLTYLRNELVSGHFSFYSFSLSLGDNIFPLMAYYLLSPFNLLLVFFSANQITTAIDVIILLKISTIGLTMSYFLKKVYQPKLSNLIFSTAFAMSGFVALYFYDLMWLDALIMLPLVTLGIRRLFYEGRSKLYVFSLLITIVTNYYLGYMTCLFSVCYFLYLCLLEKKFQGRKIGKYLLSSVLSGLMSAVILIPTLLGMMQTSKQQLKLASFLPTPTFGISVFNQLGVAGSDYTQRISHNPSFYATGLVAILVLLFFFNRNISRQQKKSTGLLLLVLFLSLFVRTFNTIWHMFQQPAGFPFRNVYFFAFIAIIAAYEAFQQKNFYSQIFLATILVLAMVTIGYFFAIRDGQYVSVKFLPISLGFIAVSGLLLAFYQRSNFIKAALVIMVCLELLVNFNFGLTGAKFGDQLSYQKNYRIEKKWFQKIQKSDSSFYRIDNEKSLINGAFDIKYNNYNDALLFNSRGVSLYSSTLNDQTRQMLSKLGYYSLNSRRISALGETKLTDALLSVKYRLHMSKHDYDLFEHKALSLGIVADQSLLKVTLGNNALQNQERIWQSLTDKVQGYFVTPAVQSKTTKSLTIKPQKTGQLYLLKPKGLKSLSVNNKKIDSSSVGTGDVINLGKFQQNQTLTINSSKQIPIKKLATLDENTFDKSVTKLQQHKMNLYKISASHILGTVDISKSNQGVFLSIPFDKGWQVHVDGKKVPLQRAVGNLSYLKLSKGFHQIELQYQVPGLKIGAIVSFLAVVIYLGIIERKKFLS